MRVLIDTHVLIWHLEDDANLSLEHSRVIDDLENEPLVSIASLWEIAIKQSKGKLELSMPFVELVSFVAHSTTSILPIDTHHILRVAELPYHHNDPFDRLIIAQALAEHIPLITSDPHFEQYGVDVL